MKLSLTTFICFSLFTCFGQDKQHADSLHKLYISEMKMISNTFSETYYPNRPAIYSLNEPRFLKKMESLKQPFINLANKYAEAFRIVDNPFIPNEQRDITYFFDRMILDYPYFHENHTGQRIQ